MKITEIPPCIRCGAFNVLYYIMGEGAICQPCKEDAETGDCDFDCGEEGHL